MNFLGIGGIIKGVGNIIDDLHTSDEEKLQIELERQRLDYGVVKGEQQIELARATHKSIFVAGARPALMWVGVIGLAYQFILYPLVLWFWALAVSQGWLGADIATPPALDWEQLMVLAAGSGAVAGMRSYDKRHGKQTDAIRPKPRNVSRETHDEIFDF